MKNLIFFSFFIIPICLFSQVGVTNSTLELETKPNETKSIMNSNSDSLNYSEVTQEFIKKNPSSNSTKRNKKRVSTGKYIRQEGKLN
jgi:hypothetical protein